MTSEHRASRVVAYDYLRVFAMLAVVAIHILRIYRPLVDPESLVGVLDDMLHFAVPVFFFTAGALVWARPWRSGEGAWGAFMRRRVPTLLAPYLAWTAFYLGLTAAMRGLGTLTPAYLGSALLTGTSWYHLYYVPVLFVFYLVAPLVEPLAQRSPEALLAGALLIRIVLMPLLGTPDSYVAQRAVGFAVHVVNHLPDMALGTWFALRFHYVTRVLRWIWPLLIAGASAWISGREAGLLPDLSGLARSLSYALPMVAMVLGLAGSGFFLARHAAWMRHGVYALAPLAFGVYVVHPVFTKAIEQGVTAAGMQSLWHSPAFGLGAYAAVLAASIATTWALSRTRVPWLVGLTKATR